MIPLAWRLPLRTIRVLLGLSGLIDQLIAGRLSASFSTVLFGAYTAYAIAGLAGRSLEDAGHHIIALQIDILFLFLALSSNTAMGGWVATSFLVYVLTLAILDYEWWWPPGIAVASIVVLNFLQPSYYGALLPVVIGVGLLGAVMAADRHFVKERVEKAERQSVAYRYESSKARESEKQRIAADFHDGPLQSFISFQMRLEIIRKLMDRDQGAAREELSELQELCQSQVQELRSFVRSMRPVDVDGSLHATLRRVVDQFQKDSGIPTSFVTAELADPADPEISLELLQIVREALFNIHKHSAATRVAIGIQKMNGTMEISIEDNGTGFPFTGRFTLEELELLRLGPGSIKRRVRSLGGELVLDSKPGQGAGLKVRLAQ